MHKTFLPAVLLLISVVASHGLAQTLPEPAVEGLRYYYPPEKVEPREIEADICVYGGTSGGVVAAIQARRMGKSAVLLSFGKHVGGLTTGGLSHTDGGGADVCGGIAREFYNQIGQSHFKPSDAEDVYKKMLAEAGVEVHYLAHLDKVTKQGTQITSISMENGLVVKAKQFIDATYEGDLLARAGVSYAVGREANNVYDETYDGIRQPGTGGHNFPKAIDPYVKPGDPSSGLLPRIVADGGVPGEGDKAIQAYCFRMRLVKGEDRLPFPKPNVYDTQQYEVLARLFESGADPRMGWSIDTNNHHLFNGAYFIDFVGGNTDWPEGDWKTREQIYQDHANYQIGVMYYLTHSPRIPSEWREKFAAFGLPTDEYRDTSGWTHELYIREGRRMLSDYVMTQENCQGYEVPEDSIGLASYNMDSHHCQMVAVDGAIRNEGNVEIRVSPYPIAYRAITPKSSECTNLLVPVALSSSHIAFGSIRMEPVFMILGQSAATAASQAIDDKVNVQNVQYDQLAKRLLEDGQIIQYKGASGVPVSLAKLKGIGVDDRDAKLTGEWEESNHIRPFVGRGYRHDKNEAKGECTATFTTKLKPGEYEVRLAYSANGNRASNLPVTIKYVGGEQKVIVNQREKPSVDEIFVSLGNFRFDKQGEVVVSNEGTNGHVIIDAVVFVPVE
ncbi:FAD-dependent oxidoreductase [Blastopirellula marina]|uniref:FAD-dependent oxidoreductase n=1 Tax=Blastopirellula marina TaxID=124 RepID=A0A2S8FN03_9BACT|nr:MULTISPECIES: FAD-dependent oxidoreductase [Pirellulaceae]PQO33234.1 FAD-dependent oxidoreductase [Blastopirellula marina]RCS52323.1 FAD-dependent oxidoreductase [Bremerella cremea]